MYMLQYQYANEVSTLKPCALVIGFPEWRGGPRADVGTLLIVHFKVLDFFLAKPNTQQDEKTHFRTSVLFFEQLAPDLMIKT